MNNVSSLNIESMSGLSREGEKYDFFLFCILKYGGASTLLDKVKNEIGAW